MKSATDTIVPLRLTECGETLTVRQICAVFQFSRSHYYELVRHRAFPIKPLKGIGVTRYAKSAVEAYFAGQRRSA